VIPLMLRPASEPGRWIKLLKTQPSRRSRDRESCRARHVFPLHQAPCVVGLLRRRKRLDCPHLAALLFESQQAPGPTRTHRPCSISLHSLGFLAGPMEYRSTMRSSQATGSGRRADRCQRSCFDGVGKPDALADSGLSFGDTGLAGWCPFLLVARMCIQLNHLHKGIFSN
jgi:hypothetical protein